ncbi:PKD-like family lipoprotein [Belliella sp. DSM 111904]|uniref:PKD-like family lipoprotein n=1 Tax=Belliella filtrata TaxID=2923435 RepID=A0ABS9V4R6_9BACT|nr:PKD-like family lipoprotein [Belliella filtrata]MCH7411396.1 PKD-like family lipoprotein [Belliella filtrata]
MKSYFIISILFCLILTTSCYEDLGNYNYELPEEPQVFGVADSVFRVSVGDSLKIHPILSHSKADKDNFSYEWQIQIAEELRHVTYTGQNLDIQFGFKAGSYPGIYSVYDKSNGMKYFYPFTIESQTQFSRGILALCNDNGQGRLSFVRPDSTVINNLYQSLNGGTLPNNPIQLVPIINQANSNTGLTRYWLLGKDEINPGVGINAGTLFFEATLKDNFFAPLPSIEPNYVYPTFLGASTGVFNNKLYLGTTSTQDISPDYGRYGNAIAGDYSLAPSFIYVDFQYYLGFDIKHYQFVRFASSGAYYGVDYRVSTVGTGFDPKKPGLVSYSHMFYLNGSTSYAYGIDSLNNFVEFKFMLAGDNFVTDYVRKFVRPDLINESNLWIGNQFGIIYFTSNEKIYRYNPLNEEIIALLADFGGKTVTMIEFVPNSDYIIAGTEGSLYYLDIGTGKTGNIVHQINGFVGAPVDVYIRN